MKKYAGQVNFRIDDETMRKMKLVCKSMDLSASELFRLSVLREYETLTDTIRVPVMGTISAGGIEYIGNDTEPE